MHVSQHSVFLLKKFKAYGVIGRILHMITSYPSERQQVVLIRGAYSSSLPVAHGLPQGSIVGPILFLIMIKDFIAQALEDILNPWSTPYELHFI